VINLRQVQLGHRKFLAAHDAAVLAALNEARQAGIDYTAVHPQFTPRSGAQGLAHATSGTVVRTSRGAVVRLQNRKKYAAAIDRGARPHVIRARSGGMLAFRGRDGQMVFRKSVHHPGNKPYRFLYRATMAAGRIFLKSMLLRMPRVAAQF